MAALSLSDYRTALRNFIKDHEALNRLLKFEEENTSDELDMYINMALGFLNSIPPILGSYTLEAFPMPSLLMHQAVIECLISNSIVNARNELTYNNGGVTVKIPDGNKYLSLLQALYRMTDQEIAAYTKMKVAININGGYGGVYSPYAYLHNGYQSLQPNSLFSG